MRPSSFRHVMINANLSC